MSENEKALADARRLCASVRRITVTEHETRLAAHVERLLAEVERLREGRLTPDEFQNLCHNLKGNPDLTPEKFFDGCAVYQVALFGVCERDRLAKRVVELEAALRSIVESADDELRRLGAVPGSNVAQIEADARAALLGGQS